jgi:hypothetical protein
MNIPKKDMFKFSNKSKAQNCIHIIKCSKNTIDPFNYNQGVQNIMQENNVTLLTTNEDLLQLGPDTTCALLNENALNKLLHVINYPFTKSKRYMYFRIIETTDRLRYPRAPKPCAECLNMDVELRWVLVAIMKATEPGGVFENLPDVDKIRVNTAAILDYAKISY